MDNDPKLAPTSNYDVSTKSFFCHSKGREGECRCINSYSLLLSQLGSSGLKKIDPPLSKERKTRTVTLSDANRV